MKSGHAFINIQPGVQVLFKGKTHHIKHIIDLNEVLLSDDETNQIVHAAIGELGPVNALANRPELVTIPDKDWEEANRRLEIIKPLLSFPNRSRKDVADRASNFNLHTNTLYEWIKRYESTGLVTDLIPRARSDKGLKKIAPEIEEIIKAVIEAEYLTKQKKSQQTICNEVRNRCLNAGITPPHNNTIRNRINSLSAEHVMSSRRGSKHAAEMYSPIKGNFPGADWPLSVVQIDHTPLDIILVDDIHRHPVGRPWITLAIDVFSRMVVGFYVSFDPPGALSTGLCLAHAILPKNSWLAKHDIKGEWPCWGLPAKLHIDNAREFRGNMLQRACMEYGIDIEWRPVARPHFGGHVERLLGTFAKEIHNLPGTTFSNIKERGDYESSKHAALTLSEFETWFITLVVDVYHQRRHSGINMAPMEKYRQGIFGDKNSPGRGLPSKITDETRLRLDLMPFEERTIQDYGVVIDEVHYYHDVLRKWINAPDLEKPKYKRKFMFRRDPRDISTIWFYDPELNCYFPIPYRDTSHPPISIWELRDAKRKIESDGNKNVDERALFEAYDRMREIEIQAQTKTLTSRRMEQRRRNNKNAFLSVADTNQKTEYPNIKDINFIPEILPFDDMDDLS